MSNPVQSTRGSTPMSDFDHLSTPRFVEGDRVTYYNNVTRTVSDHATVRGEPGLVRDEPDDPDDLIYRVYRVALHPAGETIWPEDNMLRGWLVTTPDAGDDADDQGERFDVIAAKQGWDEKAQLHVVRRFVVKKGEAAALAEWAADVAAFENTGGESAWGR